MDHKRALGAQFVQRAGNELQATAIRDTDHLSPRGCRIRQWPDHVHHRGNRKLATYRTHMTHRGMHQRREHEHEADFTKDRRHVRRCEVDLHAKRLEQIGAAAAARKAAIAVLCDAHTARRGDDCRRRRDVERRHCAATGTAGIHEHRRPVGIERDHRAAQCTRSAGDLRRRLALHAQAHQQGRDLRRRRAAGHHDVERAGRLRRAEVMPHCQSTHRVSQQVVRRCVTSHASSARTASPSRGHRRGE